MFLVSVCVHKWTNSKLWWQQTKTRLYARVPCIELPIFGRSTIRTMSRVTGYPFAFDAKHSTTTRKPTNSLAHFSGSPDIKKQMWTRVCVCRLTRFWRSFITHHDTQRNRIDCISDNNHNSISFIFILGPSWHWNRQCGRLIRWNKRIYWPRCDNVNDAVTDPFRIFHIYSQINSNERSSMLYAFVCLFIANEPVHTMWCIDERALKAISIGEKRREESIKS